LGKGVTFALHFLKHIIFVMPKMKTHSSAKKRFKVTGTGKVKRNRARLRHIASTKTKKQKRHLRHGVIVDSSEHARIERLLVI
jgi:large subunit ribosomal protein L35